jgi:anti-sigma factor RsiW
MQNENERPICHRAEDLVTYLYGEATAEEAGDFSVHIQQCAACRAEFNVFNRVHESIVAWRNEALGPIASPVVAREDVSRISPEIVPHGRRLPALAALREFFRVSPLWLRGATAFATLLMCVLGVITIARWSPKPADVVQTNNGETYTRQQLETEVKKAVARKEAELMARQNSTGAREGQTEDKPKSEPNRIQLAVDKQPKSQRPRGLTRREREQLAADLRLMPTAEDEELPLILPDQERPNH